MQVSFILMPLCAPPYGRKPNFSQKSTKREEEAFKNYNEYLSRLKEKIVRRMCLLDVSIN